MTNIFILLLIILFSPLILIVILFESTIAIPIIIYTIIKLRLKEGKRKAEVSNH